MMKKGLSLNVGELSIKPWGEVLRTPRVRSTSPLGLPRIHIFCGVQENNLRNNTLNDFAFDVRQAEVAAAESVNQARVIQAQKVQDRRMQIADADLILDG